LGCLVGITGQSNKRNKPNELNKRAQSDRQTNFAMKLIRFEDLDCWKEARQLTRQVYEAIEQTSA
jgi:hypothetical protein